MVKELIEYWKRKAEKETGLEKECCMEHVKYYESLLLKKVKN